MRGRVVGVVFAGLVLTASAAAAQPSLYATVTGSSKAGVAQFDVRSGGLLAHKSPGKVGPAKTLAGLTITPDGRNAYVAVNSTNPGPGPTTLQKDILQFSIDRASGKLVRKKPFKARTGLAPTGIVVTPNGRFAYVATSFKNTIWQYRVQPSGQLKALSPGSVKTGDAPLDVAVSPNGRNLYAANVNEGSFGITQYAIAKNGTLHPLFPAQVEANQPSNISLTPDGRSAYAPVLGGIEQYDVGSGGALRPKIPDVVPLGIAPDGVAISATGRSLYVGTEPAINQFDIAPATGKLTPKSPPTVAVPGQPIATVNDLQVGPGNRGLYAAAACCASVFQYSIRRGPETLVSKSPALIGAFDTPNVLALTPDNPTAAFSVRRKGMKVFVDATRSYDSGARITLFSWSFGDGSHTAGRKAGHRYKHAGRYRITLKLRSRYGCGRGGHVFTGHVALCTGAHARLSHAVRIRR